jgi:hypothetical protein
MRTESVRKPVSWVWLLALFTIAGFIETLLFGQLNAIIPLYLPRLGIGVLWVASRKKVDG